MGGDRRWGLRGVGSVVGGGGGEGRKVGERIVLYYSRGSCPG